MFTSVEFLAKQMFQLIVGALVWEAMHQVVSAVQHAEMVNIVWFFWNSVFDIWLICSMFGKRTIQKKMYLLPLPSSSRPKLSLFELLEILESFEASNFLLSSSISSSSVLTWKQIYLCFQMISVWCVPLLQSPASVCLSFGGSQIASSPKIKNLVKDFPKLLLCHVKITVSNHLGMKLSFMTNSWFKW